MADFLLAFGALHATFLVGREASSYDTDIASYGLLRCYMEIMVLSSSAPGMPELRKPWGQLLAIDLQGLS